MTFENRRSRDHPDPGDRHRSGPGERYPTSRQWREDPVPVRKGRSLSTSKVLAGGLAAATSAVLGSYLGVLGTVGGAAAASVATALSSELYQRSIEHTSDRLRGRGRASGPQPMPASGPPPVRRRGGGLRVLIGTLVIFAVGIGVVSGIEWARGAPLSGGTHGTSLGRVLGIDNTLPVVGGLLGGSHDGGHSGDSDRGGHGVVGGLLSGLTGSDDDQQRPE